MKPFECFDEVELAEQAEEESFRQRYRGCCGACGEFSRCRLEGHEEVGWCSCDRDFVLASDPDECD